MSHTVQKEISPCQIEYLCTWSFPDLKMQMLGYYSQQTLSRHQDSCNQVQASMGPRKGGPGGGGGGGMPTCEPGLLLHNAAVAIG